MLDAGQLLDFFTPAIEPVDIGRGDRITKVYVREISSGERDEWRAEVMPETVSESDGKIVVRRKMNTIHSAHKLLVRAICDQAGKRLFGDEEAGILAARWPGYVVDKLFLVAQRLSGLDIAAVETAAKNSEAAPSSGSSSDSPSPSGKPSASSIEPSAAAS